MIENKQQRPILIASFSGVLSDALNSHVRRFASPQARGLPREEMVRASLRSDLRNGY